MMMLDWLALAVVAYLLVGLGWVKVEMAVYKMPSGEYELVIKHRCRLLFFNLDRYVLFRSRDLAQIKSEILRLMSINNRARTPG